LKSILIQNIKICNDKKFYTEEFISFIKDITSIIKEEIINDKSGNKINEYIDELKTINDYLLYIIFFSTHQEDSNMIIENIGRYI
jgi:hypothetical protein